MFQIKGSGFGPGIALNGLAAVDKFSVFWELRGQIVEPCSDVSVVAIGFPRTPFAVRMHLAANACTEEPEEPTMLNN